MSAPPPTNVNPPMFAAANDKSATGTSPGDPPAWLMEGADPLDVDLLAEYLLDDGKPAPNGMTFDFNIDAAAGANTSTVVSPEQSEDGAFPPVAETSNPQLALPPQQPQLAPQPPPPAPVPAPPPPHIAQAPPQPIAQAPAPLVAPAPPPPMAHAPMPAHHHPAAPPPPHQHHVVAIAPPPTLAAAIPVAPAPPAVAYAPAPVPVAYAPAAPLAPAPPGGAPGLIVHHHQHGSYPKRQRVDTVPVPGVSPIPSAPPTTSSIVPGGQQLVDAAQAAMQTGGRGRKKSQAQIDRRRERNRILARRTRLRKKFFFESLQKEVMDLQRQNAALKDLVKSKFSMEESRKVLETCKAAEKLPEAVVEACGEHAAEMDQQDFNLVRSVQQSQHSFIITDPCLQDNPIVFASDGFLKVTGYAREDVLGRNCRFLQGAETSKAKLDTIRRGLSAAEDVTVTMVNYMADGTPFWNKLFIAALRDSSNNIVNFIGVVVRVASPPEGDPEFGKVLSVDGQTEANGTEAKAIAADGAVRAIEGGLSQAVAAAQMP